MKIKNSLFLKPNTTSNIQTYEDGKTAFALIPGTTGPSFVLDLPCDLSIDLNAGVGDLVTSKVIIRYDGNEETIIPKILNGKIYYEEYLKELTTQDGFSELVITYYPLFSSSPVVFTYTAECKKPDLKNWCSVVNLVAAKKEDGYTLITLNLADLNCMSVIRVETGM